MLEKWKKTKYESKNKNKKGKKFLHKENSYINQQIILNWKIIKGDINSFYDKKLNKKGC